MSSTIWTRCGADSNQRAYSGSPFRVVETQHVSSTRKLARSAAEHELLEQMLDEQKPAVPAECAALHYLLYTPFRYPPRSHGSRFRRPGERGVWYGAETLHTALAEVAYYRFRFIADSHAQLVPIEADFTAFQAAVRSRKAIDLTAAPFDAHVEQISSPVSYRHTQPLGTAMRAAGVELFRYRSARERQGGACVGIFACSALRRGPLSAQTWKSYVDGTAAEFRKGKGELQLFMRSEFEVAGELPEVS